MGDWLAQIPAVVVSLGILVFPGLPVALFLRLRGAVLLGTSIAVSLAAVAAASLAAPLFGMTWSLVPVIFVAALMAIIAGLLTCFGQIPPGGIQRKHRTHWLPLILASIAWVGVLVVGIGDPTRPNQLYDAIFHLNAVEFIAQTGDASPLHMTMSVPNATLSFYPTLWHALVSLVVPVAGGIVQATNVVTVVTIALIWPVATTVLSKVLFPSRPKVTTWAPLVGLIFSVFPLGFLNWGVLYPNLLGTMLVPLLLAHVLMACERGMTWTRRTLLVLVAIATAGAVALGHPSALLAAIALLVPFALERASQGWKKLGLGGRVVLAIIVLLGLIVLALIWWKANVTTNNWLPELTMAQGLGEVALLSPVQRTAGLVLGPLAAIGIWRAAKDRLWWVLGAYAVSIGLYMTSVWFPDLPIRSAIVGVWYDDSTRVGALLAIFALPLAALGASVVTEWLGRLWSLGQKRLVGAAAIILVIFGLPHLAVLANDTRHLQTITYNSNDDAQLLTSDEIEVFEKADALLADGDLVIGDPLTGSGLLLAYTGHRVVFTHATGSYGADAALLGAHLVEGGSDVCKAAERLGITHALDFGDRVLYRSGSYTGLHGMESSPILTEVATVGDAALYELTGCE